MIAEAFCSQNSEVECTPIKTYEEAISWKPTSPRHCTEPLRDRVFDENIPRTLVCHDMKGGYLEDRFLNGCHEDNCYNFVHWSIVDTFIYFSHHFITIPPCGWITAAHRNGTSLLGTFITEWDEGAKTCEMFLKNNECVYQMSNQLVDIASFYGFDGWLINIENKIQVQQLPLLKEFVSALTKGMHKANSRSLVIWYDSVIETGELKWQDSLNEHNRDFFLACDGIFLNYGWKDQDLVETAIEAGSRKRDVYVGVDVFGRNERGKVGFDVHYAIRPARDHGLSVAIFAPGWVYETLGPENFWENQHKFWESLTELCFPHRFKSLPFSSTFCPGQGKKTYRKGMVISNTPWFNLSLQQPQPSCHKQTEITGSCSRVCVEDAYSGGGCLKLAGVLDNKNSKMFCIFLTHFGIEKSCIINYTFKRVTTQNVNLILVLDMLSPEGQYELCLSDGEDKTTDIILNQMLAGEVGIQSNIKTPKTLPMKIKHPITCDELIKFNLPNFHLKPMDKKGWITRSYFLEVGDFNLHAINGIKACIMDAYSEANQQCSVLLGEVQVAPKEEEQRFFTYKDFKLTTENNRMFLQCVLEWCFKPNIYSWDIFYKFNRKYGYIGTTTQTSYRIHKLELRPKDKDFVFGCPIQTLIECYDYSSEGDHQLGSQIEFFLNSHSSSYFAFITETLKINFDVKK